MFGSRRKNYGAVPGSRRVRLLVKALGQSVRHKELADLLVKESRVTGVQEALNILVEAFGVDATFIDTWGRVHRTDLETARQILGAKGVQLDAHLVQTTDEVVVISEDELPSRCFFCTPINDPREDASIPEGQLTVRVVDASGRERSFHYSSESLSLHTVKGGIGPKRLSAPFPEYLEPGIYRVLATGELGEEVIAASAHWIVCPRRTYLPQELEGRGRIAGVGLALYAVRSESNWGVGDFSDLKRIIDWAADDLGADFVGLNPLHALFNRQPFNTSPYLPSSRLFRNYLYLDVCAMRDFQESAEARRMLDNPETRARIQRLRDEKHVDYDRVAALKLAFLREVFRTFLKNHSDQRKQSARWSDFQAYIDSEGTYLERFATFCALEEHFRLADPSMNTWKDWPPGLRNASSEEVQKFRLDHEETVLFWMYLQWQIEEQLGEAQQYAIDKGMLLGLYHDESLAVDRSGADFWAMREFFHNRFTVGAPPDAFAPDGQNWGFAPPNRERVRAAGYAPFLKKLEANCRGGKALRIDHVMQIHRLYWIPEGRQPSDGVYVRDYESDLLNLIALASQRTGTVIVGEDLGTVPLDFRDRLMAKGVFSYRLFYFEQNGHGNLAAHYEYPENALASISTHDLPTLAGFWSNRDIDVRSEIGQLNEEQQKRFREERTRHKSRIVERLVRDGFLSPHAAEAAQGSPYLTEDLHSAVLAFLFHTPSKLVLVNQEDVFLDERQQNIPGTVSEHANWVTKMRYTVEDLRRHPEAIRLTRKFKDLLDQSGRSAGRG